jgi:hypothetical protein
VVFVKVEWFWKVHICARHNSSFKPYDMTMSKLCQEDGAEALSCTLLNAPFSILTPLYISGSHSWFHNKKIIRLEQVSDCNSKKVLCDWIKIQHIYCINECLVYVLVLSLLIIVSLSLSAVTISNANGQNSCIIGQVHVSNISQNKWQSYIH